MECVCTTTHSLCNLSDIYCEVFAWSNPRKPCSIPLIASQTKKLQTEAGTKFKFASGHLSHAFAIKKPKKQNPEKNPKPENISEEMLEKEAEKIALSPRITNTKIY